MSYWEKFVNHLDQVVKDIRLSDAEKVLYFRLVRMAMNNEEGKVKTPEELYSIPDVAWLNASLSDNDRPYVESLQKYGLLYEHVTFICSDGRAVSGFCRLNEFWQGIEKTYISVTV